MKNTFELTQGNLPILVSMPHNGVGIPEDIAINMTKSALAKVDTDWYMDKVYQFAADMGCSILNPRYSRYVIDLNRPEDDESLYPGADTTELCPTSQFDNQPIYLAGKEPSQAEINSRINAYWKPYHQQITESLQKLKRQHGYVLLFEAHSIKSVVPRFFDGQLADFNFGNFDQKSSCSQLFDLVENWQPQGYSKVVNGRFKGGYITRHYGNPSQNIDSLQLELSQATYMNEADLTYDLTKASKVIQVIQDLFTKMQMFAENKEKFTKL